MLHLHPNQADPDLVGIHRAVLEDPADDRLKLLYADKLEEDGVTGVLPFMRQEYPPDLLGRTKEGRAWGRYAKEVVTGPAYKSWSAWLFPFPSYFENGAVKHASCFVSYASEAQSYSAATQPFVFAMRYGFPCALVLRSVPFLKRCWRLFEAFPFQAVWPWDHYPEDYQHDGETSHSYYWIESQLGMHDTYGPAVHRQLFQHLGTAAAAATGLTTTNTPVRQTIYGRRCWRYLTRLDACKDLSRACVAYGRDLAGLPPLPDSSLL